MAPVNQSFESAPMGRRAYFATVLTLVLIFLGLTGSTLAFAFKGSRKSAADVTRMVIADSVVAAAAVVATTFERSRLARFRIEDDHLVLGRKRYPLLGATAVELDPKALCWAVKKFGNGGLGGYRGLFWSRRMGSFTACATNPEKAVVIRWPDKTVVVSPADTEFFLHCARSAAKLS